MRINKTKTGFFAALILLLAFPCVAVAQGKPSRNEKIVFKTLTLRKSGTLRGRQFHDFTFNARAGRQLTLTLTSKQNVNFNLLDKRTMTVIEADQPTMQVQNWSGRLPKTGNYVIRIFILPRTGPKNRTADYRLAIALSDPDRAENSGSSKSQTMAIDNAQGNTNQKE